MKRFTLFAAMLLALVIPAMAEKPQEYFTVGNPINYCGDAFYFGWSAHPHEAYYIQEYLPEGENFERYNRMFTVSVLLGNLKPIDAIKAKIAELDERKKTDPVTNYLVAENNGDYLLEFIVSDSKGDKLDCVEVDIHYYRQLKINGKKASVLSFYSVRAYGDDIVTFMKSIPERRQAWYDAMIRLDLKPQFLKK